MKDMKVVGVQKYKRSFEACLADPDAFGEKHQFRKKLRRASGRTDLVDFREICGQESARRGAAEIAVSGFHNILFIGPPGTGKPCWPKEFLRSCPPLPLRKAWSLQKSTAWQDF